MHSKYQKTLALILLFIGYSTLGAQTLEWVRQLGSPQGHVYTTDYTSDNSGNFYRVGAFTDQVDFDLGPGTAVLTAVGNWKNFIQKLDANGNHLWVVDLQTLSPSRVHVDPNGNLLIMGYYSDAMDVDPGPGIVNFPAAQANESNLFVIKLDANGGFLWALQFGDDSPGAYSIATASNGDIYLGGAFSTNSDLDPGPGTQYITASTGPNVAAYILKLSSNGVFAWAKVLRGFSASLVLQVNSLNELVCYGTVYGDFDTDPGPNTLIVNPSGGQCLWIAKYTSNGDVIWGGGLEGDYTVADLTLGPQDQIYLVGYYDSQVDLDPTAGVHHVTSYASGNLEQYFISILSSQGAFLRGETFGVLGVTHNPEVDVNASGEIVICAEANPYGRFNASMDTNSLWLPSVQDPMVLLRYSPNLELLFAGRIGDLSNNFQGRLVSNVFLEDDGGIYLAGHIESTVDLDPGQVVANFTNSGGDDIYFAKLMCSAGSVLSYEQACDTAIFNGQTFTQSGVYHFLQSGGPGCDSIHTLIVELLEASVSPDYGNRRLVATLAGVQYRWLACDSGYAAVPGAIGQTFFVPGYGGSYALEVSQGNCADTSDCFSFIALGIAPNSLGVDLRIAQTSEGISLLLPGEFQATLLDLTGRVLTTKTAVDETAITLAGQPAAVYLVRAQTSKGLASRKVFWPGN